MTIMNKAPLELSKLAIDRTYQKGSTRSPVNYSGIFILALISASLFFVGKTIFYPVSPVEVKNQLGMSKELNSSNTYNGIVQPRSLKKGAQPRIDKGKVKQAIDESALDASGHIVARRIATVSSRVTGKLNLLNIEEGQTVNKADVLAELDDKQATIAYQLALAELSAKQASFDEFTLLFKQQSQRFKRNKSLANRRLISQQLLEDSEFKNAQLAIQIRNKQAMVLSAQQRVELAQYQLNQHKIRAPFDGVVISKNAQVGELISAGSSGGGFIRTGVGTIVDMSSLEIEVEVGESYINRVYAGQKVIAKLDAYPKWKINSEVVAVIPTADRQKASIKVRVKLLEVDPRVLPDMGVKVSFLKKIERTNDKPNGKESGNAEIAAL